MDNPDLTELRESIADISIRLSAITRLVLNILEFDMKQGEHEAKMRYESLLDKAKELHSKHPPSQS
jgi:hypothetical protein